jgi:type II secretory pathway pseudopilin PulG
VTSQPHKLVKKIAVCFGKDAGIVIAEAILRIPPGNPDPSPGKKMSYENYDYEIKRRSEAGHSLIDLLIALTILGIVVSAAVGGIAAARDAIRLSNSAQIMSAYLEKARLAAIRCHCSTTVQISSTGSYTITAPLKNATVETINYPLEPTVTFQGLTLPLTITFDWRGRADQDYHLTLSNPQGTKTVDLSGGGSIKINSTADYSHAPTIQANVPTELSDDSYVTHFADNNSNSNTAPVVNPKNHKKPKK